MPDQTPNSPSVPTESQAAANPPVAPTPEPPGIRAYANPFEALQGSPVYTRVNHDLLADAQHVVNDPKARTNFLVGLVQPGEAGGENIEPALQSAKDIVEGLGLKYKGELVKGSDVHMFEHPDHPGKTAALEGPLTTQSVSTKMADKLKDFDAGEKAKASRISFEPVGGKAIGNMQQGGHAGGGVASVEELARPGRFVKASRSGALTDQGKTPDFNLRPGEVGYQVKPDGSAVVVAGQETPTHKLAIQKYAKEVFPQSSRPIPRVLKQTGTENMNDPDTRFNAARHEAGHAVISEALNPGTVSSMSLDDNGGKTIVNAPNGKQTVEALNPDELRDMIATSLAGGMTEPGGTTIEHASGDVKNRGTLLGPAADTITQKISRLVTGSGTANDPMLQNNQTLAEAKARVTALLADPKVRKRIETVASHLADKGKLSGDDVRSIIQGK